MESTRNPLAVRIGILTSLLLGALFLLYAACFIGILAGGPAFTWKGLPDYLEHVKSHSQAFQQAAYAGMLAFGFAFAVLAECVREAAPPERRFAGRIGAGFAWLFALAIGINYFLQLTDVRLNVLKGTAEGLEQLVMANPYSAAESVNMLGWTVLLGLSCLCLAFAVDGGRAGRAARVSLLACGVNGLLAAFAYALDAVPLLALCMYPLLGGTVLAVSASLGGMFRRMRARAACPAHG